MRAFIYAYKSGMETKWSQAAAFAYRLSTWSAERHKDITWQSDFTPHTYTNTRTPKLTRGFGIYRYTVTATATTKGMSTAE